MLCTNLVYTVHIHMATFLKTRHVMIWCVIIGSDCYLHIITVIVFDYIPGLQIHGLN